MIELAIERINATAKSTLIKFVGLDHINDVESLLNRPLLIRRDQLLQTDENEYFIRDLIGLCVRTVNGKELGILTEVLESAAHDIYEVRLGTKTLLIPAIKDCICNVDLVGNILTVDLPEGFEDLN